MRIQHNILAMNAYRNYNNNTSALGKNLEKLSSGYKINRAGDDAAGLAISEKMRAQITGLTAAQKNVKDGVSLVKTAEGAMQEIQDMLNRMDYLATQSANGTYDNEVDRANLQKEVDALKTEINRIADSANFNGIKLLDGSLDSTVNETVTNYTSGKNNVPILQNIIPEGEETEKVGTGTVLHVDGATATTKTSFNVELHDINVVGAHGDTLDVDIGGQTMTFTFDKSVASHTATALTLKAGSTLSADDLAAAIKKAWDETTDGQIGGQDFTANTTSGGLNFVQTTDPTNSTELVEPCKEVKIQFNGNGSDATKSMKLTAAQQAALAESDKIILDGQEYALTLTAVTDAGVSATYGNYKIEYNNGKLSISNIAGTAMPTTVSIGGKTAAAVTAAATANGTDAATGTAAFAVSAASAVSSGKITLIDSEGNKAATTIDLTGAATNGTVAIGGVTYNWELDSANGALTLTAASAGTAGNQTITMMQETVVGTAASVYAVSQTAVTTGAEAKGASAEYDLSGVTAGYTIEFNGKQFTVKNSVEETLREIATFANSSWGDLYDVEANGTTLKVTAAYGTTSADELEAAVGIQKGGVKEEELDLKAVTANASASGTWNVKTTENKQGAVSGGGVLASSTFELNSGIVKDKNTLTIGNKTYTFKVGKDGSGSGENIIDLSKYEEGDKDLIAKAAELLSQDANNEAFTIGYDKNDPGVVSIHEKQGQTVYTNGELSDLAKFDELVYFNSAKDESVTETTVAKGNALTLQIGDTSESFNQMKVSVGDMHTSAMGTGKYTDEDGNEVKIEKTIADIDISNQEGAAEAVNIIKNAINYVSGVRGDLGAVQNRLEHTQNNLSVMAENIQDAESTIRDTDVAEEMMSYVKNNILVQSAQAMLAQANQVPQGVLQLLG